MPFPATNYALTFDDGPTAGPTEATLDILKSYNAVAAFFVIGRNVARNPLILGRICREGHIVANHTWDHWHYGIFRGTRYWVDQIVQTDAIIERATGLRPALFRPPMGWRTPLNTRAAQRTGHRTVMWDRRAYDGVRVTAEEIFERVAQPTQGGDIVLLHDGMEPTARRDPWPTIKALPKILDALGARGLTPVGVDELLKCRAYLP